MIIGGNEFHRNHFPSVSPFYPDYQVQVAGATLLDTANAIGRARRAIRPGFAVRANLLEKAARLFAFGDRDVEHIVRMTGVPLRQAHALLADIPRWLNEVPSRLLTRFELDPSTGELVEPVGNELSRLMLSPGGFCYAVTPGNDPRAAALAAANLCALGIPFVLKAARQDAAALLVVRALIQAGFDPDFASLLYFESGTGESSSLHIRLVDGANFIWTFGPDSSVDHLLRYRSGPPQALIDLSGVSLDGLDDTRLRSLLVERSFNVDCPLEDHFADKVVLRHNSGNCAAIAAGPLNESQKGELYEAIAFPLGCTATKSIQLVESPEWITILEEWLRSLRVGDPLDSETQVGYVYPATLDYLETVVRNNRLRAQFYGGKRLSAIQTAPLLVSAQEDMPDFFADEIPAYVLAVRNCANVQEAVRNINSATRKEPRLAVSCLGLPDAWLPAVFSEVRAHAILINQPTSRVIPSLHEGNDYPQRLLTGRMIIKD